MTVTNASIGIVFDEIADWLELDSANPFRIRAYRNAARTVTAWPKPLSDLAQDTKALDALPGIGKDLAAKISEIALTGSCKQLKALRQTHPRGLRELLHVPGVGPRKASRLYREADIHTAHQLVQAARSGQIRSMPGFGPRSEHELLQAASNFLATNHRWKLAEATQQAEALNRYFGASRELQAFGVAGSYRRQRDTVGDLDVLAASTHGPAITRLFLAYPEVSRVISHGTTRSSVILKNGMQVDFREVKPESFGAAMVYFTGSKAHNVALRRLGQKRGLKINEYGVYRDSRRIAGGDRNLGLCHPGSSLYPA